MKISYNLAGAARKPLVAAVSKVLNTPSRYLGTPNYDYQIGGYNIDRNGMMTGPYSGYLVEALKVEHGLIAADVDYELADANSEHEAAIAKPKELPADEPTTTIDAQAPPMVRKPEPPANDTNDLSLTIEIPLDSFTHLKSGRT